MEDYAIWWVIMGILLIIELTTGSFYLMMLAIAAIIGAISAHLGLTWFWQWLVVAISGVSTLGICYLLRKQLAYSNKACINNNLDIGATVMVKNWQNDGLCQVKYRGANWSATSNNGQNIGLHKIVAINGNRLVLEFIN